MRRRTLLTAAAGSAATALATTGCGPGRAPRPRAGHHPAHPLPVPEPPGHRAGPGRLERPGPLPRRQTRPPRRRRLRRRPPALQHPLRQPEARRRRLRGPRGGRTGMPGLRPHPPHPGLDPQWRPRLRGLVLRNRTPRHRRLAAHHRGVRRHDRRGRPAARRLHRPRQERPHHPRRLLPHRRRLGPDPRRRPRRHGPRLRADLRQPDHRHPGHRRRPKTDGEREAEPGSLLGAARRGQRQLRGGHRLHLPYPRRPAGRHRVSDLALAAGAGR